MLYPGISVRNFPKLYDNDKEEDMRKIFFILSTLVVLSMILSACAPQRKSKDPTTLVVAVFGEPETLDPALAYETAGAEIIQNVYEPLIFYKGDQPGEFVPMLAESWTISEDGTTYTFKIRKGVKFHEGGDLTPEDVAYTFQRGLLFGGTHGPQWLLAEPFFGTGVDDISLLVDPEGNLYDDREGIKAADPEKLKAACQKVKDAIVADNDNWTVTMKLAQPWGPFLATIAQSWGSVMDKEWVIEHGGWDGSCDTWQNYYAIPSEEDPFTPIANGTGPFKLDHWTQGQEIVLVRNENYWREPAKLQRVVIKKVDEWGTRFAMLQAGDADFVAVPPENRPQVDEMVGERCEFDLQANTYKPCVETDPNKPLRLYIGQPGVTRTDIFMNFNIAETSNYVGSGKLDGNGIPRDFFSDVHIRKAFAYCFDWDTYIKDVFRGEAVQSPVIPLVGMPGYEPDAPKYSFDKAKCEQEFKLADLDKDGIPAGEDPEGDVWTTGFRLQALYNQGNTTRQTISEILASNINSVNDKFIIETVGLPWPAFLRTIRSKEAPYFVSGWLEDIHDPHNWYVPYLIGTYAGRQNLPSDLKAQFKELINKGVAETDPAKRHEIYKQLNALFYENVPTILLAVATSHAYEPRYVEGVIRNPLFPGFYYYTISKK
jgi:peptide/nickel transport system substrate-binding protein